MSTHHPPPLYTHCSRRLVIRSTPSLQSFHPHNAHKDPMLSEQQAWRDCWTYLLNATAPWESYYVFASHIRIYWDNKNFGAVVKDKWDERKPSESCLAHITLSFSGSLLLCLQNKADPEADMLHEFYLGERIWARTICHLCHALGIQKEMKLVLSS